MAHADAHIAHDGAVFSGGKLEDLGSYREGFKNVLRLVVFESLAIVVLLGIVFYRVNDVRPQDRYFAENADGSVRRMVGLAQPNMSQDAIVTWAGAATSRIMTFGFDDIDASMAAAKKDFTPEGWKSFSEKLKNSSLLRALMANQQLLTSVPLQTPTLVSEGLWNGQYTWMVNVNLVMTTRAGPLEVVNRAAVRLIIVKMPTADNPMGIGIKAFYLIG